MIYGEKMHEWFIKGLVPHKTQKEAYKTMIKMILCDQPNIILLCKYEDE